MKEKTSPWFKVFALCTALGLGGAYVWRQQQKAVPQFEKTAERMVLSGSKSAVIVETSLQMDQEEGNGILDPQSSDPFTFKQEKDPKPILLPGSKSDIIELTPKISKYLVPTAGSKSKVLPSPELPVTPQQRTLLPGSKSIPMPIFRDRLLAPADEPKPVDP